MEHDFYLSTCKIISNLDQATSEEVAFYNSHLKEPFECLTIRHFLWRGYELLDLNTDQDCGVVGLKTTEFILLVRFIKDQIAIVNNTYPELIDAIYFLYFIRRTDRPLLEPENNDLNRALDQYDQSELGLHARIIEQGARKLYQIQKSSLIESPSKPITSIPPKSITSIPPIAPKPITSIVSKPVSSESHKPNKKSIVESEIKRPVKPVLPIIKSTKKVLDNLKGEIIIFYGFQCPKLKADIEARGGKVTKNLSGLTTFLVMKDINSSTNNVQRAQQQGVKLISKDEFIKTYID